MAGTAAAVACDLRTRRIPDIITAGTATAGLALAAVGAGELTIGGALIGLGLGLVLMLPGYAFGGTGAGDVKLFAALGTILGPARIVSAFLYMAIAGGALALAVALERRHAGSTMRRLARLVTRPRETKREIESPELANRFAYGPAIAAGAWLAMWHG